MVNLGNVQIKVFISIAEDRNGNFFYNINKDTNQPSRDNAVQMRSDEGFEDDNSSYNQSMPQNEANVNIEIENMPPASSIRPRNAKGAFYEDNGQSIIELFKNADASTVIHELGHFFLNDMRKFADNPDTKRQLDAIYKYVGSLDGRLTTEQHEYFARSFEAYLLDGKAPNSTLKGVFGKFKKWLGKIYGVVRNDLDVELTEDVRKTFDEMLGGRGLDFAMQSGRQNLMSNIEYGNISQNVINRAIKTLRDGKMSKADLETLIEQVQSREITPAELNEKIGVFEILDGVNREEISQYDIQRFRNLLERRNVSKRDIRGKIDRLLGFTKPKMVNGKAVGRERVRQIEQKAIRKLRHPARIHKLKSFIDDNRVYLDSALTG